MSETLITAIVGFFSAIVGAVIGAMAGRRKVNAEATNSISDAATKIAKTAVDDLLAPLTARLDGLETEIIRLKRLLDRYAKRVIYLMSGIETLIKQIKAKNETPCWQPDEWDPEGTEE